MSQLPPCSGRPGTVRAPGGERWGQSELSLVDFLAVRLTFLSYFLFDICASVADVHILGQRRVGHVTVHVRA